MTHRRSPRHAAAISVFAVLCLALAAPLRPAAAAEPAATDMPARTVEGNSFIAPAGWKLSTRGAATIIEAPEGGSYIAFVDVRAPDADAALTAAWKAYKPDAKPVLKVATDAPDKDGWTNRRSYEYETSPNDKRDLRASLSRANDVWSVVFYDMAQSVGDKRLAQIILAFDDFLPKGYTRETFAGRKAAKLDAARLAQLRTFVDTSMKELGVPGIAVGIIENGKVVLAEGFGVRELGRDEKVDADTLFMVGSNTKAMTTLMLAKLVDEGKIGWNTRVTTLLPSFRLGNDDTTRQVEVRHLICACTGLPRQDLEFIFDYAHDTPATMIEKLGKTQPTSAFGEMFQYSNLLAAAAGFVGGHVAHPVDELGVAYDKAMQERVFDPLGMKATTFDFARALGGNHAMPHAIDVDGKPARSLMESNYAVVPVRPAGAAWSDIHDMLAYVGMELADGALPDGSRYMTKDVLYARRAPQVSIGKNATYGMGLEVDTSSGTPVVHHGGATFGFMSDMIWLPDHGVGAVILTNSERGGTLLEPFQRKLLEILFDGRPEADVTVASRAKAFFEQLAAERKSLTIPPDPAAAATLAKRYTDGPLGDITVSEAEGATVFDFDEWKSAVASRKNADGTTSFVSVTPGVVGWFEFVVGSNPKRTLTLRDAQHEYVFEERP